MLKLIHKSHLGMVKCKQRAREVMYWPNMNSDIEKTVRDCNHCAEYQNQQPAEPLKPTMTPDLPFSKVGCDLFDFESKQYLVIVDYYSKYIDAIQLHSTTTTAVINALKTVMATHGIVKTLRSENGPQFSSSEFKQFCKSYGIEHQTSSPHFQSSNGEAERAIQTVKRMWSKSSDNQLALLDYRTTPLEGINLSPSHWEDASETHFPKFYRRHYELISKYNVGLKTLLSEGLSEPEFYGDLVYKFKKLIGSNDFSFQFRKIITRYRRIGYNLNVHA